MPSEKLERAVILARSGNKEEARELLNEILDEEPANERAFLWYVDTMAKDDAERLEALSQFLAIHPGSTEIQRALTMLRRQVARIALPPDKEHEGADERELQAESDSSETPAYFKEQPASVSPRFAPSTVRQVRLIVSLAIIILALFGLMAAPIWNQESGIVILARILEDLTVPRPTLEATNPPTRTPSQNSILFSNIKGICPEAGDLSAEYTLDGIHTGSSRDHLKPYETNGLRTYYRNKWYSASQPSLFCDVMVYTSIEDAEAAFRGIRSAFSQEGTFLSLRNVGSESTGNLVEGTDFIYNFAYRDGRAIIKLTTVDREKVIGRDALEFLLSQVDTNLRPFDTD